MRWDAIYKRIENIYNPIGAEIGVYKGELSEKILTMKKDLYWTMIDPWSIDTYKNAAPDAVSENYKKLYQDNSEENYKFVCENMREKFFCKSLVIRNTSLSASSCFDPHCFDIIFIDAAHDFNSVYEDLWMWWPKIKPGGFLSGHDYGVENFPGVKKAVDKFFDNSGKTIELDEDFTWFVKK